tara:strand:+ start:16 stop:564 length:549 start_codon:yes stop_codon:yes gene_type:complete
MAPQAAAAGGLAGLIKTLAGAGVKNPVAASVIGSTFANLPGALLGPGGAFRTNAQGLTTGTPAKFTITAQDVLALEQFVIKQNRIQAVLRGLGFNAPDLNTNEILDDTAKRLNEQLNQSTMRKMEELRVQGELASLPNLMTSIGNIGSAQSNVAATGLGKVLESAIPAAYIGQVAAPRQITI